MHHVLMDIKRKISAHVTNYLAENKLSQHDLAKKAKVNQSHVSRVINGDFKNIYASQYQAIFHVVGIETNKLEKNGKRPKLNPEIETAIFEVWDGTQKHAKALANVIRSVGKLHQ